MQTKLAMFEYLFVSSFHYAFLYDLTQKIYSHITRNSQHYHVNIVNSRKIYLHSNIFLTTTLAINLRP